MPALSLSAAVVALLFVTAALLLLYGARGVPTRSRRFAAVLALPTVLGADYVMLRSYAGEPDFGFERSQTRAQRGGGRSQNRGEVDFGGEGNRSGGARGGGDQGAGGSGMDDGSIEAKLAAFFPAPRQAPRAGARLVDCDDCPDMIVVQPGYFTIGADANDHDALSSEKPAVVVRVAKPYAIGRTEVTVGQYMAFVRATGASLPACSSPIYTRDPALPLSCVSWREAQTYVAWLKWTTGKSYRLPTEAEWEYAARGGATTPYVTGTDIEEGQANIGRERFARIAVGSFPVNGFGLADVHGSVAELAGDCWAETHRGRNRDSRITRVAGNCRRAVLRDAGAYEAVDLARLSARRPFGLDDKLSNVGFRVARDM